MCALRSRGLVAGKRVFSPVIAHVLADPANAIRKKRAAENDVQLMYPAARHGLVRL
ncbi:hypothetical protein QN362_03130 [Actimicrobium sp. CCC2.4]|uniref:hypothetical protein n=1 Tax=Actimicrobium sp. CCC2.4 TaxID=3048606 RepID=UPI002AC994F4|nr:hypothetical protein [Actimicrobium sp. CCC2.4]MEB0134317.1 hypothetical protein [Actimicrobium sp. CCC2.4]WPX32960.1 hypothetical protein RHM62_03695 [Actimicrobium sp. CCC2.4]